MGIHLAAPWRRVAGAALMCGLVVAVESSTAAGADSSAPQRAAPGTWQAHTYSFQFMGFTSTYSCDGLADKLRVLLLASGARRDAKSRPGACASAFGRPDKFARADLTFFTLAPLAPAAAADGKAPAGVWRSVALTARAPREIEIGDCEVVEQFRERVLPLFTTVLPLFTTRDIESHTTCIPNQEAGSTIDLKFEVFTTAAPTAGAATNPR